MDFYRRVLQQASAPPLFQETVSPQAFATALIPSGHFPWLHQQPPRPALAAESTVPFSSLLMAAGHQVHNAEQHTLSQQEQRRAQQYNGLQAQAELDEQVQQLIQMKWQLHGQQAVLQLSAGGQAVVAAGARTQTADNAASSPQESEKKRQMKAKTHCSVPSSVTSNPEEQIEAPSSLPPLKKRPQRFLPPSTEDKGGKHEPKQKKQKRSAVKKGSIKTLPSDSVVTKTHIVYDTTDKDVLSVPSRGRGYDPPGNQAFHALCKEFHDFYMQARSKLEKTAVVSFLVDKIHSEGGRFLRRNDKKDDIQEEVSWVELSKEEAGQKTRDVLIRLCSKKR